MSDTLPRSSIRTAFRRALTRDLFTGREVVRIDVERRINEAPLPDAAKEVVRRTVRRTRLWSGERADVADELIAHFLDGLAAGETPDALIASFGDERHAARLIRRAKRRNRPLAWHALRWLGWGSVALVVAYLGLGVYFHLGSPSPSVDYIAQLNEPAARLPAERRAWPLFREALLKLDGQSDPHFNELRALLEARPGWRRWPEAVAWLERNAGVLEPTRRAADRPVLGFVLGPAGDAYDPALYLGAPPPAASTPDRDRKHTPLVSVLLPHLRGLNVLALALAADAAQAREAGDRERLMRDLAALSKTAEHVGRDEGRFLVGKLSGLRIRSYVLAEIGQTLDERPALLTDADLRDLAHQLAGPRTAADLLSLEGERMFFYDVAQRIYTDDGDGDGRMTPDGLQLLRQITSQWPVELDPLMIAAGPSTLMLTASRREAVDAYDRLMDQAQTSFAQPLREAGPSKADATLATFEGSRLATARYLPITVLAPATHAVQEAAERYLGRRDGVLVGIALELFHRRHGGYPTALGELAPGLLPEVPLDRISGGPLRYRIVDGRPVVYSTGADGDDDGGRRPTGRVNVLPRADERNRDVAARWHRPPAEKPDGDWVVYPPEPVSEPFAE